MQATPTMTPAELAAWQAMADRGEPFGFQTRPTPKHGTLGSYDRGCRCQDCRAAKSAYAREYWARRRART